MGEFDESRLKSKELFTNPEGGIAYGFVASYEFPWEALPHIKEYIRELGKSLSESEYDRVGEEIWISREATVAPSASISGPCIIMPGAEVRQCAFIRGSALVGRGCVVGNSTELKNCILFDRVQVPHFNYVGDSILGYKAHLGAGVITSNVKCDKTPVSVRYEGGRIFTDLTKMGAIVGDGCEVGCNTVLNPGTVLGRGVIVYPLSSVRGYVEAGERYKGSGKWKMES